MQKVFTLLLFGFLIYSCSKKEEDVPIENGQIITNGEPSTVGCPGAAYGPWQSSNYVLPYPVGKSYKTQLSHCTSSYHGAGQPDEFAIDFAMPIGTLITATRRGFVIHVEETGVDGEFPNNLVVVEHIDNSYAQYMHLTRFGAIREVGDYVEQGDSIGYSGATGLAFTPHLHFVVTEDGWQYPYRSVPYNFKNTAPNPYSLKAWTEYLANPY